MSDDTLQVLTVHLSPESIDPVLEAAAELAPTAWVDEETQLARIDVFVPDDASIDALAKRLSLATEIALGAPCEVLRRSVAREDWSESWKRHFHAERVSKRLVVKPSWEEWDCQPGDVVLKIDPGMTFGTGLHGTTRACLRFLDDLAAEDSSRRVLDMGCGSGILSLAAVKLGFPHVDAFDMDPDAIDVTLENVASNGMRDRVAATISVLPQIPREMHGEIVVANILATVLLEHAEAIAAAVPQIPSARLVLSGILVEQYPAVLERFKALGFDELRQVTIDEWRSGLFVRNEESKRNVKEGSGLARVSTILAVSSCKGGVGKSTVAALLAKSLHKRGKTVGLLDADIFGPSAPTLFNSHESGAYADEENFLIPRELDGLKVISFGFMAGEKPSVMRGPMVSNWMQQLLHKVRWGELDILVIDMPPGTGDIQLTVAQSVQVDASVIVTTPHQLSLTDVRKGIQMFEQVDVPVLGVIENMAWFVCDKCDAHHEVFGASGGTAMEQALGIKTLARFPLMPAMGGPLDEVVDSQEVQEATDCVVEALQGQKQARLQTPTVSFDENAVMLFWPDGSRLTVANRDLRAACRCALCIDEMTNEKTLDSATIPADIHATEVRVIGNYAIAVTWSDGHSTGFFPYAAIRKLAAR